MKKVIIASTRESAGKTSIISGLATSIEKSYGYIKPFGDRLIYRKKKNWDYDANLIVGLLGLDAEPESISLGFDHSKLKYVYDETSLKDTLLKMVENTGKDKEVLFIESGKDMTYGSSINLDFFSLAKYTGAKLYIIVSGDNDAIIDDLTFLKTYVNLDEVDFGGIIINKVADVEDFETIYQKTIEDMGYDIVGIIPYKEQLTYMQVDDMAERLFAKVIAGEGGLNNIIKNIFVGAMSTDESMRNPLFNKENKLLITSGDRSDMILAALESDTVGIVLTNNILPPSNIISRASERNIPLLLVSADTLHVSMQIDRMEALLTKDSDNRLELLGQLLNKYLKIEKIVG